MKLVFLHGMPGVGKLTIGRELSDRTGFGLFHNHLTVDLVLSLFEFGSQPFIELREKIWLDTFAQACDAKLEGLIFTFAFEKTVREEFVPNVVKLVESRGGEVLLVNLYCAYDELERRLTDPAREKFGKLTSLELFRQLNRNGTFDTPDTVASRISVDTTTITPPEAARKIATELNLAPVTK